MSNHASTRVQVGTVSLLVSPHAKGWRFGFKGETGKWEYVTRKSKGDAKTEARKKAAELHNRSATLVLSPDELTLWERVKKLKVTHADLDVWEKRNRLASPAIGEVVKSMISDKTVARGAKGVHLSGLEKDLKSLPQDRPIDGFSPDDVNAWLHAARLRGVGQRRLKNLRSGAITLWRWARKRGYLPDGTTAPEKTEEISDGRGRGRARRVEIYTPEEFLALFAAAPPEHHGFLVLGAFAGIRSEELSPQARANKDGLDWRDVDRAHGVIRVPAHISKVGHPRVVPILPNLEAWLKHIAAPTEGPILKTLYERARQRRREALGKLWKRNGLRHSFGTYRTAAVQSLPQVALEMGNSVSVIQRHYYEAVTKSAGEAWFNLLPDSEIHQNISEPTSVQPVKRSKSTH